MPQTINFTGYAQPNINHFAAETVTKEKNFRGYNRKTVSIRKGTFVINFTDGQIYEVIWQGFITDWYRGKIFENPQKTKIAVISILNNYIYKSAFY